MILPTEPRRDRWNRYLVVPPDGTKPVGYTRATTIAKTLDDQSNLINWRSRMTAIGLAHNPDLLALVTAAADDKKKLDSVCERAAERGGATIRRDMGTALHGILEQALTVPGFKVPADARADIDAILRLLDAHRLAVLPNMIERQVVLDGPKIAGTFDLAVESQHGDAFIADLKTGANVQYGALGFAIQLAIYAQADNIYLQGSATDGSNDMRLDMPEVSQTTGFIIHCEPGSAHAELHRVDLEVGKSGLETALVVRAMRTFKTVMAPIPTPTTVAAVPPAPTVTVADMFDPSENQQKAARLLIRARKAVEKYPEARDWLRDHWPEHVPALTNNTHDWKTVEINQLADMIQALERGIEPLGARNLDGPVIAQHIVNRVRDRWESAPHDSRQVLERLERDLTGINLLRAAGLDSDWNQNSTNPIRTRQLHLIQMFCDIAREVDPAETEQVLDAIADAVGLPGTTRPNPLWRYTRITTAQAEQAWEAFQRGILYDLDGNGNTTITINQKAN